MGYISQPALGWTLPPMPQQNKSGPGLSPAVAANDESQGAGSPGCPAARQGRRALAVQAGHDQDAARPTAWPGQCCLRSQHPPALPGPAQAVPSRVPSRALHRTGLHPAPCPPVCWAPAQAMPTRVVPCRAVPWVVPWPCTSRAQGTAVLRALLRAGPRTSYAQGSTLLHAVLGTGLCPGCAPPCTRLCPAVHQAAPRPCTSRAQGSALLVPRSIPC